MIKKIVYENSRYNGQSTIRVYYESGKTQVYWDTELGRNSMSKPVKKYLESNGYDEIRNK